MSVLGISSEGLVFEGRSEYGAHMVWPQPVMTLAKFVKQDSVELVPAKDGELGHCYFREDSFDPVSRIRRGRFYQWGGRSHSWDVLPSPNVFLPSNSSSNGLVSIHGISGYQPFKLSAYESNSSDSVILGSSEAFSIWSLVGIETISSGEMLVTLKSRQSLGILPEIYWAKLPFEHSHKVQEAIDKLADDYRRAGPESVIDRAREAATAILSAYLQAKGVEIAKGKDLGDLVKLLSTDAGKNEQRILTCAAEIPQRLHSRGKSSEKEKRDDLRPIREQDAELAVQCVGVMLCDLRWADWK